MMGAAGKDPKASILTLFIKVNITVTLHTLKSLALVSGNAKPVYVLLGPAGRIAIFFFILFFFFFFVFFLSEALPTCVKVPACCREQCSSAALTPTLLLACCLPADPYKLAPPSPPSPGLQAKSSSFRTGPPVLNLLLLLRQSLSSATSDSALSVSLLQGSL